MTDTQPVLEANQTFYRAFEKKDLETMSAIWSQGTGTVCIHPGWDVLKGWDPIRQSWDRIFQNTNYIEFELDILNVDISGDLAYVILVENLLQVVRGQRMQAKSLATNIFERMAGKWYLIHHHGSPVMR